jgi:hypothetical protein
MEPEAAAEEAGSWACTGAWVCTGGILGYTANFGRVEVAAMNLLLVGFERKLFSY